MANLLKFQSVTHVTDILVINELRMTDTTSITT